MTIYQPKEDSMHHLLSFPGVDSNIRLLEAWIESLVAYKNLPGLSIGIVCDQDLIWARGFGFSDPEAQVPASPKTLYRIASITKLFTSTAIMQLRDAGKLNLDDPVSKHLSWYNIRDRFPDSPKTTIRHLLTHTSGLPREAAFPYWIDFRFPSREQIRQTLPDQETAYPRETMWKYSNLGLSLAGEIVQEVSGEPYPDYIKKHILEPLEMNSTRVVLSEKERNKVAKGFGRKMPDGSRLAMPFTDSKGITPAANMSSNVEDLAKFISLQFRTESKEQSRVLKASTLREMHRIHWIQPDWTWGWGLGFGVKHMDGKVIVSHGGALAGYKTRVSFCPEIKVGVVVGINSNDGDPLVFCDQVFRMVAPHIAIAAKKEKSQAGKSNPSWKKYIGKYRNLWWDAQIMIYGDNLVLIDPQVNEPQKDMVRLEHEKEHVFRLKGNDGSMSIGEKLIFELDANENITRVKVGESYMFPIDSWYDPMPGTDLLEPVD